MSIFQHIKERVLFTDLAHEHGLYFNRNNKANCPFHDDENPSFHNYGTHGYCFSCNKIVDVIDLEAHYKGLSPFQAALSLAKRYHIEISEYGSDIPERFNRQVEANKLLERLAVYANKKIQNEPEVLEFLKSKGLDKQDVDQFLIGFVGKGLSLSDELRKEPETIALALEIGLINIKGDFFRNRIIFPVWNSGRIVYLSGRAFPNGNPKYLHLKSSELAYKQIAFAENLKSDSCMIVESIADAIILKKHGFQASALLGTNPGEHGDNILSNSKSELYFLMDGDVAGEKANYDLAKKFHGNVINLEGEKDPGELLNKLGSENFKDFISSVKEKARFYLDLMIEKESITACLTEIDHLEMETEKELWLKKLSDKHGVGLRALKKDLSSITKHNEIIDPKEESGEKESDPLTEYTGDEIYKAKAMLESPDILTELVKFLDKAGYVREARNKKLAYLACTSRKLPGKKKAISLISKGESGSGKSELVKQILKLIPSRDVKEFTFITEKALLHSKSDLSHKILCVFEREGSASSNYTIRTAISEEKLSIFIPRKNPATGDIESIEKEILAEGLVYIETTTEERIEEQNANRTFEFYTDSSPEQTREILKSQAKAHIHSQKELEEEYLIWRCLQDLMESIPVYVSYAEELAEQFPVDKVRARRDFPRLLALIESSALLHQFNRDRIEIEDNTFIVANEIDFRTAIEIIMPILSQTYKNVSPKEESLVSIIKDEYDICESCDLDESNFAISNSFSPKELHKKIMQRVNEGDKSARGFKAYSTLRSYIRSLASEEEGILEWNGKKGAASRYILVNEVEQNPIHLSLSLSANYNNVLEKHSENDDLQEDILAKRDISPSLANTNQAFSNKDHKVEDWLISSPLAKSDFSLCLLYKSLDFLPISSLAKRDLSTKKEDNLDPWDLEGE